MTKKELLQNIAAQANLTLQQAENALKATFDNIRQIMVGNETISIPGFGNFGAKMRPSRKGRNPRTGEEITISATNAPYFKASSTLKEILNSKSNDQE